jgi:nitroreductase
MRQSVGKKGHKVIFSYSRSLDKLKALAAADPGAKSGTPASIMSMMLTAHENNLGTCRAGAFREEEVSRILNLPQDLRPVSIVTVG